MFPLVTSLMICKLANLIFITCMWILKMLTTYPSSDLITFGVVAPRW